MIFLLGIVSAAPQISNVAVSSNPTENSTITVTVTATAADNGTSVFSVNDSRLVESSSDATSAVYTWDTDFNSAGTHAINFTVSDADSSDSQTQTITVASVNRAPVANAGSSQSVDINATATLSGSGTDEDGDSIASFSWVLVSTVSGANAQLTNANQATASFVSDKEGSYVFNLTVTDSNGASSKPSQVTVTVNVPVRLVLEDLDIKVGSSTDSNIEDKGDGYNIDKDAEPGDKITVKANVENTFTEDIDIEDVFMKVTIKDIDDDDDLEDETSEDDIRDGDDQKFELDFNVPERVDEGTYDLIIEIEGDDENGGSHRIVKNFILEVDKESHDVRINKADLRASTLSCSRSTSLEIEVVNFGADEEEEILVSAKNSEIGLDYELFDDGDIELETGSDDDAELDVSVPIVASDASAGSYPIEIKVFRDESRLEDTKTVTLIVEDCSEPAPTTPSTPAQDDRDNDRSDSRDDNVVVVVDQPKDDSGSTVPSTATSFPVLAQQVSDDSFADSTGYVVLLGVAALVLIVLIIMVGMLLGKKK